MKQLLTIVALVALLGVGCAKQTDTPKNEPETTPNETAELPIAETEESSEPQRDPDFPIEYDLGEVPALPERSLHLVRNLYTAEQLVTQSEECGTNLGLEHFTELLDQFRYQRVQRYDFLYRGESQEPTRYTLTVLDNGPDYQNLEDFKKDFAVCAAGSIMRPLAVTDNWLVFESDCGLPADDSNLSQGCEEIRTQLQTTLQVD